MGYVQPFFDFRAKAVEFRLYQFRPGGGAIGVNRQHLPHRVFPQGQEEIAGLRNPLKMFFQEQPPFTVLLNGESRRDKAKTADFILPVVKAQQDLKVLKGD
jgi:hypothetical protein